MEISDVKYSQYLQILREELLPAMGCTEPIAMAYAAAKARQTLGAMPDKIDIVISGNIIKNVKKRCRSQHRRSEGHCGCRRGRNGRGRCR